MEEHRELQQLWVVLGAGSETQQQVPLSHMTAKLKTLAPIHKLTSDNHNLTSNQTAQERTREFLLETLSNMVAIRHMWLFKQQN